MAACLPVAEKSSPTRVAIFPRERPVVRRVLIVSPHFPPINAPDHHRVRLALPHLRNHGWEAEVLTVRPEDVEGATIDPELARSLPVGLKIHWACAWPAGFTRRFGVGNLAWRSYRALQKLGATLLRTGAFDLVFFSTTQFGVLPLGPYWHRRFGIPYVVDFQDEWISDYYARNPGVLPPGGRLKYAVSSWLARRHEPDVVASAAQLVAVSPAYLDRLRLRHPSLAVTACHEMAFGGTPADFAHMGRRCIHQSFFDALDGRRHWVYVGRGGADMHRAASALFLAVQIALEAGLLNATSLRLHFIGTSYAPGGKAESELLRLAGAHGLEGLVREHPRRVPYFTALRCLADAHAVLLLGSDDSSYTPSKIFPALLARRPLLAVLHSASGAALILHRLEAGTRVTFRRDSDPAVLAREIADRWIDQRGHEEMPRWTMREFTPYSAETMTQRLGAIFDAACVPARAGQR